MIDFQIRNTLVMKKRIRMRTRSMMNQMVLMMKMLIKIRNRIQRMRRAKLSRVNNTTHQCLSPQTVIKIAYLRQMMIILKEFTIVIIWRREILRWNPWQLALRRHARHLLMMRLRFLAVRIFHLKLILERVKWLVKLRGLKWTMKPKIMTSMKKTKLKRYKPKTQNNCSPQNSPRNKTSMNSEIE